MVVVGEKLSAAHEEAKKEEHWILGFRNEGNEGERREAGY
jgi:hypothetical protein